MPANFSLPPRYYANPRDQARATYYQQLPDTRDALDRLVAARVSPSDGAQLDSGRLYTLVVSSGIQAPYKALLGCLIEAGYRAATGAQYKPNWQFKDATMKDENV